MEALIVAILIGAFGPKYHLVTYTTSSANLMIREIGIALFLAAVGKAAIANESLDHFNLAADAPAHPRVNHSARNLYGVFEHIVITQGIQLGCCHRKRKGQLPA